PASSSAWCRRPSAASSSTARSASIPSGASPTTRAGSTSSPRADGRPRISLCVPARVVVNAPDMSSRVPSRPVGPLQLLALGVNGIVGVGIFFTPATVAASAPGFAGVWVFLLTGLAVVPVAFAFAVLGRRFDQGGGPVVFARAAFGDLPSFVAGWVAYVSAFFSTAAVMGGLTRAVSADLGLESGVALGLGATALVTALGLIVATGIRISARTWTVQTVLKLLPLFALLAAFLAFGARVPAPPPTR